MDISESEKLRKQMQSSLLYIVTQFVEEYMSEDKKDIYFIQNTFSLKTLSNQTELVQFSGDVSHMQHYSRSGGIIMQNTPKSKAKDRIGNTLRDIRRTLHLVRKSLKIIKDHIEYQKREINVLEQETPTLDKIITWVDTSYRAHPAVSKNYRSLDLDFDRNIALLLTVSHICETFVDVDNQNQQPEFYIFVGLMRKLFENATKSVNSNRFKHTIYKYVYPEKLIENTQDTLPEREEIIRNAFKFFGVDNEYMIFDIKPHILKRMSVFFENIVDEQLNTAYKFISIYRLYHPEAEKNHQTYIFQTLNKVGIAHADTIDHISLHEIEHRARFQGYNFRHWYTLYIGEENDLHSWDTKGRTQLIKIISQIEGLKAADNLKEIHYNNFPIHLWWNLPLYKRSWEKMSTNKEFQNMLKAINMPDVDTWLRQTFPLQHTDSNQMSPADVNEFLYRMLPWSLKRDVLLQCANLQSETDLIEEKKQIPKTRFMKQKFGIISSYKQWLKFFFMNNSLPSGLNTFLLLKKIIVINPENKNMDSFVYSFLNDRCGLKTKEDFRTEAKKNSFWKVASMNYIKETGGNFYNPYKDFWEFASAALGRNISPRDHIQFTEDEIEEIIERYYNQKLYTETSTTNLIEIFQKLQ